MKLQYLADGSPDCPLIRLYDFEPAEAARLKELFNSLAHGSRASAPLHQQVGIQSVDGCQLDLRLGTRDLGIVQKGALTFESVLTAEGWSGVASFVDSFCEAGEAETYQWLNGRQNISPAIAQRQVVKLGRSGNHNSYPFTTKAATRTPPCLRVSVVK